LGLFLTSSPIGIVIGALIGGALDSAPGSRVDPYKKPPRPPHRNRHTKSFSNTDRSFLFVLHLVGIMTIVAKADGSLDSIEVRAMRRFFEGLGFRGEDLRTIQRLMKEAVSAELNLLEICSEYGRIASYEECLLLVRALYTVAAADGNIHSAEQSVISRVVSYLNIGEADHRPIRSEFRSRNGRERKISSSDPNPYAALGLQPGASIQEIKKAYREMAGKYHPDRVTHLGPEFIKLANVKFRAIHDAYTAIRKEQGF